MKAEWKIYYVVSMGKLNVHQSISMNNESNERMKGREGNRESGDERF